LILNLEKRIVYHLSRRFTTDEICEVVPRNPPGHRIKALNSEIMIAGWYMQELVRVTLV